MINALIFAVVMAIALIRGSIFLFKFFIAAWLIDKEKRDDDSSKPD